MILHKLIFGRISDVDREQAEEYIKSYISVLFHNGQACGEYFSVLEQGELCAYINLPELAASESKHHCQYGKKWLAKIEAIFQQSPIWNVIDDELPAVDVDFTESPFLFLNTEYDEYESPIYRGDNDYSIPLFKFFNTHEEREAVYYWQREYQELETIWIRGGALEMLAYKELANPSSTFSCGGREICQAIEKFTGIPTYYYLFRYYGRRENEDARKCPSCGKKWQNKHQQNDPSFHHFDFICHDCRLVSHLSIDNSDERHAVIGEWRK
ncbi:Zn-ribbon-containing protein [Psychrobium sp. MM17-31]|uniref:DUF2310 family Zn-ribbon-containing protein n=1 Tax=Psychrobium sp. MM17-31 TaxID=2917758 RepID=UPI001EF5C436|nr:DUF2310 family Zn-ribbon-containing protein [Psychrobium sp. MM17-31]MCG7531633.1 Zn-ribbon-containing protein [Psychrobium sp. MM17-31]